MAAALFREEGCSPYKLYLLPWVQIPLWVTLSFALRNMTGYFPTCASHCADTAQSMSVEGLLWFQDLTAADPYYVLPVLVALTNLMNIEVGAIKMGGGATSVSLVRGSGYWDLSL